MAATPVLLVLTCRGIDAPRDFDPRMFANARRRGRPASVLPYTVTVD